jgi:hypothetical protein
MNDSTVVWSGLCNNIHTRGVCSSTPHFRCGRTILVVYLCVDLLLLTIRILVLCIFYLVSGLALLA